MEQREKRLIASRDEWKVKNKERYEEVKALKMRLKETRESRDKWKAAYNEKERDLAGTQKERDRIIAKLRDEIEDIKKKELEDSKNNNEKPRKHWYPILLILTCLRLLLHAAIPFRGLSEALKILDVGSHYMINKSPSHTTIRRWVNRIGLYQLMKEKEKADDWVYILDNSIRIENRKLCLILGVRLSNCKKCGYLTFEDMEVLEIGLIQGKATIGVGMLLESTFKKTGVPLQICSDQGPDVVPAIKQAILKNPSIQHVPDTIHATTNMLKRILEKETRWEEFSKKVGEAKNKLKQSAQSELCPPQIRGKSRFLNCSVVVDWAIRVIDLIESTRSDEAIRTKLGWIMEYRKDILEFEDMIKIVNYTNEVVRFHRITSDTWRVLEKEFKETITKKGKKLAKEIVKYLKELSAKAKDGFLIGSTEIIESAFGKLKSLDRECGNSGFTSSILGIGACFGKLDYKTIAEGIAKISNKAVDSWKVEIIGETHQTKRRRLLKNKKKVDGKQEMTRNYEGGRAVA